MKIIFNKKKLVNFINKERNLGFVPTMGAIHKGHISLIKKSINQCNKTIVSIFVNRPQFNKKNDYIKYPKNLEKDIFILKKLKIDCLYLPSTKQIYPDGPRKNIKIHSFEKVLCGKNRPGHFKAVADVIDRFIKIIRPKKIYLGEKDMQQLIIIKDFIKKNYGSINVIGCKTIREKNGIAYSSRNFLLNIKEKKISGKVYRLLLSKKKYLVKRKISLNMIKNKILRLGVSKIDYVKILDINRLVDKNIRSKKIRIFIAYYLRSTRLIDNI